MGVCNNTAPTSGVVGIMCACNRLQVSAYDVGFFVGSFCIGFSRRALDTPIASKPTTRLRHPDREAGAGGEAPGSHSGSAR